MTSRRKIQRQAKKHAKAAVKRTAAGAVVAKGAQAIGSSSHGTKAQKPKKSHKLFKLVVVAGLGYLAQRAMAAAPSSAPHKRII